jgi:hypothetical protein
MLSTRVTAFLVAGTLWVPGAFLRSQEAVPLPVPPPPAEPSEKPVSVEIPDGGEGAAIAEFAEGPNGAVEAADLSGYDISGLKVDVTGSGSFVHDSNTAQMQNGPSANLFAFAYAVEVNSGRQNAPGGYYGFNLRGQYFVYDNAAASLGRDPLETFFAGYAGINGGFTRIRTDVNYHRNNGNSLDWDSIQRETRRQSSHDYNFNVAASRDLRRGTLEVGAGYTLRDFDRNVGIDDGENLYGDLAWMTSPSFAPKTETGLGFRFGNDEFSGQPTQTFLTPSFRWRWKVSGKSSVRNSFGYEMRSIDTTPSSDLRNLVYDGGIDWALTGKTALGLGYYRRVQPSFILNGQDVTMTGLAVNMTNQLPGRFVLNTRAGYEDASYQTRGTPIPGSVDRDDQFLRLALELRHPLRLSEKVGGEWAVFFNYNQNDSNQAVFSFDQNVAGVRFGLIY